MKTRSSSTALATTEPTDLASVTHEFEAMSTEELREQLAKSLELTAVYFVRTAVAVKILEDRGEDLSDLKVGLPGYLRKIACGQLLPQVVVRFAEYPLLIRKIESLPLPDQAKLAAGESVKLTVMQDGAATYRLADPLMLTRDQLHQVFASDHIRCDAEQILIVQDRMQRPPKQKTKKRGKVRADTVKAGLIVGRMFVPIADALAALGDLKSGMEPPESDTRRPLVIQLTDEEHLALARKAGDVDGRKTRLAYDALRTVGLLAQRE